MPFQAFDGSLHATSEAEEYHTIVAKKKCLRREIALRRAVYPKKVLDGKMKKEEADREILLMELIAADYEDKIYLLDRESA